MFFLHTPIRISAIALAIGVSLAMIAPAWADSAPAGASSAPFPDVPANHWAYDAVTQLKADGYLQGYPDGDFKGQRPMTRWEMAVLTERIVTDIQAKMPQLSPSDIDAIRKLVAAFGPEIDQVKQQIAALQGHQVTQDQQIAALQQEADATQKRVQSAHVGFNFSYRPGTEGTNLGVVNGGALPVTFGGISVAPHHPLPTIASAAGNLGVAIGSGVPDTLPVGSIAHGTNYNFARIMLSGQLDSHWSYAARVKTQVNEDSVLGASSVSPALCNTTLVASASNCSFTDLNNGQNTLPINLDYAYVQYSTPSGFSAQLGRYPAFGSDYYLTSPDAFLFGGGQITGLNLQFSNPNNPIAANFYYGAPSTSSYALASTTGTSAQVCTTGLLGYSSGVSQPALTGVNPKCNSTGQEFGASITYEAKSNTSFSLNEDGYVQRQFLYWDPAYVNSCVVGGASMVAVSTAACHANGGVVGPTNSAFGNFVTGQGNFVSVEADLSQAFGPHNKPTFRLDLEGMDRLGLDPFTGNQWTGSTGWGAGLLFASKGNIYGYTPNATIPATGTKDSNVFQIWFQQYGLNSSGGTSGITTGSAQPGSGLGFSNLNGMQAEGISMQRWLTNNIRIGVYGIHLNEAPGITIPVGTYTGGANTCRGCFVSNFSTNYVYLDTWLYFL
jgi:S-layer homology domain